MNDTPNTPPMEGSDTLIPAKSRFSSISREMLEEELDRANTRMIADGTRLGALTDALERLVLDYEMAKHLAAQNGVNWLGSPYDVDGEARRALKEHTEGPVLPGPAERIRQARIEEAGLPSEDWPRPGMRELRHPQAASKVVGPLR